MVNTKPTIFSTSVNKKSNSMKKNSTLAKVSAVFNAATAAAVELANQHAADALTGMLIGAARTDAAATCKTDFSKSAEGREYLRFTLSPVTETTDIDPEILVMMRKAANALVTADSTAAAFHQLSASGYELNRLSSHPHATHLAKMPCGREILVDLSV